MGVLDSWWVSAQHAFDTLKTVPTPVLLLSFVVFFAAISGLVSVEGFSLIDLVRGT